MRRLRKCTFFTCLLFSCCLQNLDFAGVKKTKIQNLQKSKCCQNMTGTIFSCSTNGSQYTESSLLLLCDIGHYVTMNEIKYSVLQLSVCVYVMQSSEMSLMSEPINFQLLSLLGKAIKELCFAENPIKIGLRVPKIQAILSS